MRGKRVKRGPILILIVLSSGFWWLLGLQRNPDVAVAFFGDTDQDVREVISLANKIGANEIYMYVGYEGKILTNKPAELKEMYGISFKGAFFAKDAIRLFRLNHLRVTAVLSSQIFGPAPHESSYPLVQVGPNNRYLNLIDPLRARDFCTAVADEVASYGFDGIYIGEPYYDDFNVRIDDLNRSSYWNAFYRQINKRVKGKYPKLKTELILPVHFFNYQGGRFGAGEKDHGLNVSLINEGFDMVGLDLSSIYVDGAQKQLMETEVMTALSKKLGKSSSIIELSLNRYGRSDKIPLNFLVDQINVAKKYHINKILLFSNKSLSAYSFDELKQIKTALNGKEYFVGNQLPIKEIRFYVPQTNNWRREISKQVNNAMQEVDGESILNVEIQQ